MAPTPPKTKIVNMANSSWFKNVAKSFGLGSLSVMEQTLPSIAETGMTTIEAVRGIRDSLRKLKTQRPTNNALLNAIDGGKDWWKNSLEDIKSGNLYNTERTSMGDDFDFGDDDFSFGDDEDFSFDVDESEDGDTNVHVRVSSVPTDPNNPMVKAMEANVEMTANAADAMIQSERTTSLAKMAISSRGFDEMKSGIAAINDNLSKLIEFNNSSMSSYITTSFKYFEDSMVLMKRLADKISPEREEEKKPTSYDASLFGAGGTVRMDKYVKMVGANFKDSLDSSMLGMIMPFLESPDTVKMMTSNPLGFLVTGLVKSFIGRGLLDSLASFDKSIGAFMPAMLNKIASMKDSDNILFSIIGNIFGIKSKGRQSIDLKGYEKGKVDFDGVTRKSIVTVIPTYLRKILAALTGKPEVGYDYSSGTFKKMSTAKREYAENMENMVLRNQYQITREIEERAKADGSSLTKEQMESFNKGVNKFFVELSKTQKVPNLNAIAASISTDADGKSVTNDDARDDLATIYGFENKEELERFRKILQSIRDTNPRLLAEAFGSKNLRARQDLFNATASELGDNVLRNVDLLNAWDDDSITGNKTSRVVSKNNSSFSIADGVSMLSDIREIMLTGVPVYQVGAPDRGSDGRTLKGLNNSSLIDAVVPKDETANTTDTSGKKRSKEQQEVYDRLKKFYPDASEAKLDQMVKDEIKSKAENSTMFDKFGEYITSKLPEPIQDLVKTPTRFISRSLDKINTFLYSLLFGGEEGAGSITEKVTNSFKFQLTNFREFTINKILNPLESKLFGEDGIFTKIGESKQFKSTMGFMFGEKGADGNYSGGLFSNVLTELGNIGKRFKHYFDGKPNEALGLEDNQENSILGNLKLNFLKFKDLMSTYLFGEKDEGEDKAGLFKNGFFGSLMEGFQGFADVLFGPKILKTSEGDFENKNYVNMNEMLTKMKERAPKALANGIVGAGIGGVAVSGLGLLGTLVGGPMGGAAIGMGLGMLTQSERFMRFMFGGTDKDGNQVKGLISKKVVDFFGKNKVAILGGAALGAMKSIVFPSAAGFLPSIFGGPLVGAAIGMGTALVTRSESFKNLLFGVPDANGVKIGGIFSKISNKFSKANNLGGNTMAGLLGGGALGLITSKLGILGGFGLMGPLGTAMIGGAAGIALSFDKWKDMVFGKEDKDTGIRQGGWVERLGNFAKEAVLVPFGNLMNRTGLRMANLFEKSIKIPIMTALDPIVRGFEALHSGITDFFSGLFKKNIETLRGAIWESVKWTAKLPFRLTDFLLEASGLKKIGSSILRLMGRGIEGLVFNLASIPVRLFGGGLNFLAGMGAKAADKNDKRLARQDARKRQWSAMTGSGDFADAGILDRLGGFMSATGDIFNPRWDIDSYSDLKDTRDDMNKARKDKYKSLWDKQREKEKADRKRREELAGRGYESSLEDRKKRARSARGKTAQEASLETTMAVEKTGEATILTLGKIDDNMANMADKFQNVVAGDSVRVVQDAQQPYGGSKVNPLSSAISSGFINATMEIKEAEQEAKEDTAGDKAYSKLMGENSAESLKTERKGDPGTTKWYNMTHLDIAQQQLDAQLKQNDNWDGIFGKAGLITMGIMFGLPLLINGAKKLFSFIDGDFVTSVGNFILTGFTTASTAIVNSILNALGFGTSENDSNDNGIKDSNEDVMGNNAMAGSTAENVFLAGKQLLKGFGKTSLKWSENLSKYLGIDAESVAAREAAEKAAKESAEKLTKEVIEEGAEAVAKSNTRLITKFGNTLKGYAKNIDEAIKKIQGLSKFNPLTIIRNFIDSAINKLIKSPTSIIGKFLTKISAGLAKLSASLASLGIIDAVFVTIGIFDGLSDAETAELFGTTTENLDWRMKLISAGFNGFLNFSWFFLFDILNEISTELLGKDFIQMLAIAAYDALGGDMEELEEGQAQLGEEYERYAAMVNSINGTDISETAYHEAISRSALSKFWQDAGNWIVDSTRNVFGGGATDDDNKMIAQAISTISRAQADLDMNPDSSSDHKEYMERIIKENQDLIDTLTVRQYTMESADAFLSRKQAQIDAVNTYTQTMYEMDDGSMYLEYDTPVHRNTTAVENFNNHSGIAPRPSSIPQMPGGIGGAMDDGSTSGGVIPFGGSQANRWFLETFGEQVSDPWSVRVSSDYGISRPALGDVHKGIDYSRSAGFNNFEIKSPVDGSFAGAFPFDTKGFGHNVIVRDTEGLYHIFAHLDREPPSINGPVNSGDVIGYTGTSGNSTGDHLHYEVRTDKSNPSTNVNPHWLDYDKINNGTFNASLLFSGVNKTMDPTSSYYTYTPYADTIGTVPYGPNQYGEIQSLSSYGVQDAETSEEKSGISSIFDLFSNYFSDAGDLIWNALGFKSDDEESETLGTEGQPPNPNGVSYRTPDSIGRTGNDQFILQPDGTFLHVPSGYYSYIGPDGMMPEIHNSSYPLIDHTGASRPNTINSSRLPVMHTQLNNYRGNRATDKASLEKITSYYYGLNGRDPFYKNNIDAILNVSEKYGVDPKYILAHAVSESTWNPYSDSKIAKNKNNLFGITAYDGNEYDSATSFGNIGDVEAGLSSGIEWINHNFFNKPSTEGPSQNTLYEMMFGVKGHQYAGYTEQGTGSQYPNMDWLNTISGIMSTGMGVGGGAPGGEVMGGMKQINAAAKIREKEMDKAFRRTEQIISKTNKEMYATTLPVGGSGSIPSIDNDLLKEMVTELKKINSNTELVASETEKLNLKDWEVQVAGGTTIQGGDTTISKTEAIPKDKLTEKERARRSDAEYKRNRKIAQGRLY